MSKAFILERIRAGLSPDEAAATRKARVDKRLNEAACGVLPSMPRTRLKRLQRFEEKVVASQASIERVAASDIRKAVAAWLKSHNLPAVLRIGADSRIADYLARGRSQLEITSGASDGSDITAFSHAEYGVAETGTLALVSGPDNPTTLNFLPENHIVALREGDVVDHYEEIWAGMRKRFGAGNLPRTVNLITGPSRSADIEQTLILGAHGPVRLHVLLIR